MGMHFMQGAQLMSFEMPMIVLLIAANALWYLVGWAKGFNEGKREGLIVAKSFQRVTTDAR
jgi:hypothetical protein